ncbi:MAG: hypothetical protein EOM02_11615, partial [Synergistales bacterium]|nr:hypothetical protein [Synergistales bacterium]
PTWLMALAERELLRTLQVGCHVPFAAVSSWDGESLHLRAQALSELGDSVDMDISGPVSTDEQAQDLGREMGKRLLSSPEALSMLRASS